ncbi:hypothetical protein L596_029736 [Steinernema carpocapsae]|nr:hypothetical protein L596_029736 [Steinernema carpocapsae]
MPMDSGYSNQPPPHMNRNNQYHEDMSNLSINDEPLANVFCPGSNDYGYNSYPNQQGYGNPSSHPQIMRCDYGSPADSSVPMGSPETDANDPCWMSPP